MANLGPYEIVHRMATGGMAEVYLVLDRTPGREPAAYALKRIKPEVAGDPAVANMLVDEGRLTARLMHRGIARTVRVERQGHAIYLIMELVDGRDLGAVLKELRARGQRLPPELAALVALRAAEALSYAHQVTDDERRPLQLVHRDVSPSNVMISFAGEVRVIDFGIARAEKRLTETRTGIVKGKYRYMAPEQALGKPVDARADVYALGVVLYEALAGQRILPALSDMELLAAVTRSAIPPLRSIDRTAPPGLARIVARAMEADLTARYGSCAELATDLRTWLAEHVPRSLTPADLEALMTALFPGQSGLLTAAIANALAARTA